MLEFILSTAIVAGKVQVGPNLYQYDLITSDNKLVRVIDDLEHHIIEEG